MPSETFLQPHKCPYLMLNYTEYCKIVIQDFDIYLQHRSKIIGYIIMDRVFILFIHQDCSRNNLNPLCNLSSVIPQIVTGQITCWLFLKRYRDMEQKPSLVKLKQRCVIENTISNTT